MPEMINDSAAAVPPAVVEGARQRVEGLVRRETPIERLDIAIEDEEKRLVRVSFSSEEPYVRRSWWEEPWIEILGHRAGEVNMFRLENRATVHYNHRRTREDRIGAVIEASIGNGRGEALLQISDRGDVEDIWNDLKKGLLCNVSVAYNIHERVLVKQNDDGPDEYRVTSWEPVEISIVDIPADPTVGVGRGDGVEHCYRVFDLEPAPAVSGEEKKERTMSDKDKTKKPAVEGERGNDDETVSKNAADELAKRAADKAAKKALDDYKAEQAERRASIKAVFDGHTATKEVEALRSTCLDDDECTVEQARELLLDEIGKRKTPAGAGYVQPGADSADKFREAVTTSIMARAHMGDAKAENDNPYRGRSFVELARASLEVNGMNSSGSPIEVIGRCFTMRSAIGLTPSDLTNILADVANKSVLLGYEEAGETWARWCQVGNLTDFKPAKRVGLSSFEDLELIRPGGEYKYGKFSDRGETIELASYGKIFPITRQAMINDDLQALTAIPNKMGRAAARVPGDLAYGVLTTNPAMSDGTVLFHSDHSNIGTSGVISATTVGEAANLMALQSDVSGNANGLNIELGYVIVPVQLKNTANVLRASEYDPASTTNSRAPNPVQNTFEVVAEARLSAASVAIWYAAADKRFDTIEVAFLDGVQEPRVEEQNGWTVDGIEYKVALDCAAAAMDHRGLVRNAGT